MRLRKTTRWEIGGLRGPAWLPMAGLLTASAIAYVAYAGEGAGFGSRSSTETFAAGRDPVQAALAAAIESLTSSIETNANRTLLLKKVHEALTTKYARHADAKVAAACAALFLL